MAVTVLVLVIAVLGAIGAPVYVFPHRDPVDRADAIFVLGGAGGETRYRYALELGERGLAPDVVMSNPGHYLDDTGLCAPRDRLPRVECFEPEPSTTRGEAQTLRRLAAERGWRTVMVVTFRPHIARASYILKRCFTGDLRMIESPQSISPFYWPYAYVYQTAGYIRAALQSGC